MHAQKVERCSTFRMLGLVRKFPQNRNTRCFLGIYRNRKWHMAYRPRREKRIVSSKLLSLRQFFYFASDSMPDVCIRCRTTRRIWTCSLLFLIFFFCPVLEVNPTSEITVLRQMLSWHFCRDEKEPLKEEKKITPIIDSGLRRETSITFDGKRSVSKTGFVGKDSAV